MPLFRLWLRCSLPAWVILPLVASCPGQPEARPCNVDTDCAVEEECLGGLCSRRDLGDGDGDGDDPGDGDGDGQGDGDGDGDDPGDGDGDGDGDATDGGASDGGAAATDGGSPPVDAGHDAGPVACTGDEHDGGDGVCVPLGTCSEGYVLRYPDDDLDGVGAGLELCVFADDADLADLSPVDGDCAPADANAWEVQARYVDLDGDGYTAGTTEVCAGDTDPEGGPYRSPRPPPVTSYAPADGDELDGPGADWSGENAIDRADNSAATADLDPRGPLFEPDCTAPLAVEELGLDVPESATIVGLRATVRRRATTGSVSPATVVDGEVAMKRDDGDRSPEGRASETPWSTNGYEEVVYGGPTDLWGYMALTPSEVNDPEFGMVLSACASTSTTLGDADVYIDHVKVEVFVAEGEDCDDDDPAAWSARTTFGDVDWDKYVTDDAQSGCYGAALPEDRRDTSRGEDCYDLHSAAFPGQFAFFTGHRGDGSWDYDCNGVEQKANVIYAQPCSCDAALACVAGPSSSGTPQQACGQSAPSEACTQMCSVEGEDCAAPTSVTVRCR